MIISIILCTYNRGESLSKALQSLAASELPDSVEWEVVVVDNNSTDETRAVTEEFCRKYPTHFRYVFGPRRGKSHALNLGIQEARGDVLAFTDDDVTVERSWAQNLTASLKDDAWAGAAGRTLPAQPFCMPSWISPERPHALAPLAIFDPPLEAGDLNVPPYGVNMAFRKAVFQKHGGFRTDLGPGLGKGIPQKCEDSEFGARLLQAGEKLRYEPQAVLYHSVPPSRVQQSYFLAWWFDKARADRRLQGRPVKTVLTVAGVPIRHIAKLGRWTLAWLACWQPARRFENKTKVWAIWGHIVESFGQSRLEAAQARGEG
jgi:glycosyltransferase involved in cell wall biosynthesis